ncbi:MAG: hypothetical protein ACLQDF_14510 [Desulfomonilia bacterium]
MTLGSIEPVSYFKRLSFFVSFVLFVVKYSYVCSSLMLHFGCGYAALALRGEILLCVLLE